MKTIYDYDNMRQKGKFEAAFKEILTHRKQLGLMSEWTDFDTPYI